MKHFTYIIIYKLISDLKSLKSKYRHLYSIEHMLNIYKKKICKFVRKSNFLETLKTFYG